MARLAAPRAGVRRVCAEGGGLRGTLDCRDLAAGAGLAVAVVLRFFVAAAEISSTSSSSSSEISLTVRFLAVLLLGGLASIIIKSSSSWVGRCLRVVFESSSMSRPEIARAVGSANKSSSSWGLRVFVWAFCRSAIFEESLSLILAISSSRFFSSTSLLTRFYSSAAEQEEASSNEMLSEKNQTEW